MGRTSGSEAHGADRLRPHEPRAHVPDCRPGSGVQVGGPRPRGHLPSGRPHRAHAHPRRKRLAPGRVWPFDGARESGRAGVQREAERSALHEVFEAMNTKPLQISERTVGDVTVLDLKGRLVFGDGDDTLREMLNRLIQMCRRRMLLNLDEVPYIDSGGLGALVSKYISVCRRGGTLKLCHVHERAFRVLNITKLLTVFESYETEQEALKSFEV